jgi:hypothetical protein
LALGLAVDACSQSEGSPPSLPTTVIWPSGGSGSLAHPPYLEVSATGGTRSDNRVLDDRRSMLRACYETGLASEPSMNGTVSFRLEISAAGLAKLTTNGNLGLSKDVESCMRRVLCSAQFDVAAAHEITLSIVGKTHN